MISCIWQRCRWRTACVCACTAAFAPALVSTCLLCTSDAQPCFASRSPDFSFLPGSTSHCNCTCPLHKGLLSHFLTSASELVSPGPQKHLSVQYRAYQLSRMLWGLPGQYPSAAQLDVGLHPQQRLHGASPQSLHILDRSLKVAHLQAQSHLWFLAINWLSMQASPTPCSGWPRHMHRNYQCAGRMVSYDAGCRQLPVQTH